MSESRDYILDVAGVTESQPDAAVATGTVGEAMRHRPWLAVHWRCCHVYSRIYRDRAGEAYVGRCPSCGKNVRARIGADGVSTRFFTAQ
ncbi:MAG: hypothetical protein GC162_13275 [Planctomycetes bacterium]|nr:hypothetical protein [Planctomycetota bacterium]